MSTDIFRKMGLIALFFAALGIFAVAYATIPI